MTTRGVACNNPMNIMHSPTFKWQGEIIPTTDPHGRLCTFDSMEDGVRAGAKTLLTYYNAHGLKTVRQIISRFAPPVENNTDAYIHAVCESVGTQPDEQVDISDKQVLADLVKAITRHEQGYDCCSEDQIEKGISLALGESA